MVFVFHPKIKYEILSFFISLGLIKNELFYPKIIFHHPLLRDLNTEKFEQKKHFIGMGNLVSPKSFVIPFKLVRVTVFMITAKFGEGKVLRIFFLYTPGFIFFSHKLTKKIIGFFGGETKSNCVFNFNWRKHRSVKLNANGNLARQGYNNRFFLFVFRPRNYTNLGCVNGKTTLVK